MRHFEMITQPSTKDRETFYEIFDNEYMITRLVLTNKIRAFQVVKKSNEGDLSLLQNLMNKVLK